MTTLRFYFRSGIKRMFDLRCLLFTHDLATPTTSRRTKAHQNHKKVTVENMVRLCCAWLDMRIFEKTVLVLTQNKYGDMM